MASYTIRFRSVMAGLRSTRKRYKASGHLREHIARFSKVSPDSVKIDPRLNEYIMSRSVKGGDEVKVDLSKTGEILNVKLAPGQLPEPPKPQAAAPAQKAGQNKPAALPAKSEAKPEQKKEEPKQKQQAAARQAEKAQKPAKAEHQKPAADTAGQQK